MNLLQVLIYKPSNFFKMSLFADFERGKYRSFYVTKFTFQTTYQIGMIARDLANVVKPFGAVGTQTRFVSDDQRGTLPCQVYLVWGITDEKPPKGLAFMRFFVVQAHSTVGCYLRSAYCSKNINSLRQLPLAARSRIRGIDLEPGRRIAVPTVIASDLKVRFLRAIRQTWFRFQHRDPFQIRNETVQFIVKLRIGSIYG
jgi:hypothetical protein